MAIRSDPFHKIVIASLAGNNYLVNLTIKHFGGREMVLEGTGNRMQGVVVIAS